jgi:hypothetical protein
MIRRLQSALVGIERAVTSIAVICLFAIMLIVVADVFMRYAVNRPFSFTYDLVGLYLMAGLFYLALSDTFAIQCTCQRRHSRASIFAVSTSPVRDRHLPVRHHCILIDHLARAQPCDRELRQRRRACGRDPLAELGFGALVPLGCAVLTVRLLLHLVAHGISLASGRNLIALPPLSGTGAAAQESNFE